MARLLPPDNPFPAGTIVTGDDFADRHDEIALLRDELSQGGRVFLLAYRRYGKSCLIHETLRRLQGEDRALTAYVDLYRANSERELWELFANALLTATRSPMKRLVEWVADVARGFRPRFSVDPQTQQPVLTLDAPRSQLELAEIREWALQLPPKFAGRRGQRLIIAFDEFQEIRAFDDVRLEKLLRATFQAHRGVSYLFAGSKPHLLRDMAKEGGAFYRFGRVMELAPVPGDHWVPYITSRFSRGGIELGPDVIPRIVTYAEGIPYYVIRLCRALWSRGVHAGRLTEEDVRNEFSVLVAEGDQFFAEAWDALSLVQRRALTAVAEGDTVFSEQVRRSYELGPSSTLARSLERLQDLSLVARERAEAGGRARYRIVDPVLRAWVLRGRPADMSKSRQQPAPGPTTGRRGRMRRRSTKRR